MSVNGNSDEFALRNVPPEPKPWHGGEPENTRQKVLLTGMDCRPGQLDLFDEQRPEPQPIDLPT